ncbi:hypothetical protein K353_02440 [Kitasatospora sp. SolWspMP-SS2h]|nr:hypothetical protein K353_02440 [Kitasatospora sp. SolWspMP-SS2h]
MSTQTTHLALRRFGFAFTPDGSHAAAVHPRSLPEGRESRPGRPTAPDGPWPKGSR